MLKVIELLLLLAANTSVSIYLFQELDYLGYIALFGGIGFSVLHFIRTYEQKRNQVLEHPDAEYYHSIDMGGDQFHSGESFGDSSDD
ncbi:hypothetical protein [Halobacillus litoralis]|uniref:Uncharacterized protein n=1 Tax=Halobacillus litoralis TaxID=45668 RepID=A0A410MBQ1_9BACI|nr:hypothetical protein [Halobacillus litoralis]QAS52108.1 hypothetical protein HLI_07655 [Halobacillus litoralis]